MIRIVTAIQRPELLSSFRKLLSKESGVCVVAEATDLREAIGLLGTSRPDILLLQEDRPMCDAKDIIRHFQSSARQHVYGISIIPSSNEKDVRRATRIGCSGVIAQDAIEDYLLECIHAVHRGELWFDPVTTMVVMDRLERLAPRSDRKEGLGPHLTRGQRRIVLVMMQRVMQRAQNAEEESRAKSRFMANTSHELRTLLNSIIGFSDLVLSETVGSVNEKQRELLRDNLHCSRELRVVLNDLLDLAKIEAGKMEVHMERLDPMALVRKEVVEVLRGAAIPKGISLKVSGSLGEVVTDSRKFKQIVSTFVSNAIKFSPSNGLVEVRVSPAASGSFRVEVHDEGPGISRANVLRLFNRFQQVDSTDGPNIGTGLGLSLSKEVAELLGGQVGVDSIVGKGSTFFVILPMRGEEKRSEPKELAHGRRRPRVLVVDDEREARGFLKRTLVESGYRVDLACHLEEAVRKCRTKRYDAITLDLVLGGDDGADLLKQRGSLNDNTPIIVISTMEEPLHFHQTRIHAQLHKPIFPSALVCSLLDAGIPPQGGRRDLAGAIVPTVFTGR